ncbi:MAG: hypothetical protein LBV67_08120, partial [Streptococcaceae bacterium]|nr:hypothetical protein [Streptococcaceae bacterium]
GLTLDLNALRNGTVTFVRKNASGGSSTVIQGQYPVGNTGVNFLPSVAAFAGLLLLAAGAFVVTKNKASAHT